MDVLIISEFCEDFSNTDNDRFFYIAKMLAHSCDVEIVTSSFRHTTKCRRDKAAEEWPFKITFIEEPGYPKNVCLQRFYSHYIWGNNVLKYIRQRQKPDVIYCAVPSLTGPNLIAKYCERNHIRFVIDVQDLWPEAFKMIVNVPVISQIGFAPFNVLANGIYKRADAICAVSDTYVARALKVNNKCVKGTTIYLGTNLRTFDRNARLNPILEKGADEIWIAYCGTLGSSYELSVVIDALSLLKDDRLKFIIMGDGPRKTEFESYAASKGINCIFTGRLRYDQMCGLLVACDMTVNPIAHRAAQSIINKHADYAASGLPVVSTQESDEYRALIDKYQMGFNCKNSDPKDIAQKIKILADDKELRKKMGSNARICAEECFDREIVYHEIEREILAGGV